MLTLLAGGKDGKMCAYIWTRDQESDPCVLKPGLVIGSSTVSCVCLYLVGEKENELRVLTFRLVSRRVSIDLDAYIWTCE